MISIRIYCNMKIIRRLLVGRGMLRYEADRRRLLGVFFVIRCAKLDARNAQRVVNSMEM
jgi:hypothetical protein